MEEWLRYEQLKQGRRGVLSPGLIPSHCWELRLGVIKNANILPISQ